MVYLLFSEDKIFGVFETEQLLHQNCFVFLYERFNKGKITPEVYFDVKKKLLDNTDIPVQTLKKIMKEVGIYISSHIHEKNGFIAMRNILLHMERRFDYLEKNMAGDFRVTATIPGRNAIDNRMLTENIEMHWRDLDTTNFKIIRDEIYKYLVLRIQRLQYKFENRVKFGIVSDEQASEISYQLWPADKANWNVPKGTKIPGEGLAVCFKYQTPGVYGIVIDPIFGYTDI